MSAEAYPAQAEDTRSLTIVFSGGKATFYGPYGVEELKARCEKNLIIKLLDGINANYRIIGNRIVISGPQVDAETAFRKALLLAAVRECTRSPSKVYMVLNAVKGLDFYSLLFWVSKVIRAYENAGRSGVCRVARAFRILYGID